MYPAQGNPLLEVLQESLSSDLQWVPGHAGVPPRSPGRPLILDLPSASFHSHQASPLTLRGPHLSGTCAGQGQRGWSGGGRGLLSHMPSSEGHSLRADSHWAEVLLGSLSSCLSQLVAQSRAPWSPPGHPLQGPGGELCVCVCDGGTWI